MLMELVRSTTQQVAQLVDVVGELDSAEYDMMPDVVDALFDTSDDPWVSQSLSGNVSAGNSSPFDVGGVGASLVFRSTVLALYSIIAFFSLLGNGTYCIITIRSQKLRSVANLFMIHLCIANILFVVVSMPAYIIRHILVMDQWTLGSVMCKLSSSIVYVTVTASFYLMMVVAIDRQRSMDVIHHKVDRKMIHYVAGSIWLLSFIVALPYIIFTKVQTLYSDPLFQAMAKIRCTLPIEEWQKYLALLVIIVQFVIPMMVLTPCYIKMCVVLWKRDLGSISILAGRRRSRNLQRKKRTIFMLFLIVAIFAVCWTPMFTVVLLKDFRLHQHLLSRAYETYLVCWILGVLSVCLSPYVYLLSDTFRSEFKLQFFACIGAKKLNQPSATTGDIATRLDEMTHAGNSHERTSTEHRPSIFAWLMLTSERLIRLRSHEKLTGIPGLASDSLSPDPIQRAGSHPALSQSHLNIPFGESRQGSLSPMSSKPIVRVSSTSLLCPPRSVYPCEMSTVESYRSMFAEPEDDDVTF